MSKDDRRDRVFARRLSDVKAFEFSADVAAVFEDMISRSVPGYPLLLHLIGLYADLFVTPGSRVYDLGCSLGDATRRIAAQTLGIERELIAVDNAPAMIERARELPLDGASVDWRCEDIRDTEIVDASLVVLNLTLQFLPPAEREALLQRIHDGLDAGGALVLSEKIELDHALEQQRMNELHLAFKKTMGYSDLEIAQKRSAIENVLVPDRQSRLEERLRHAGFAEVFLCFRCFNFVSYLAIKA